MPRRRTPGPYLPLHIDFADHPKIAALSDGAFRLHVCGMLYCKRLKLDGILSPAVVPKLTRSYRPRHLTELIDRLLWLELNGSGHYQIHDWAEWNVTKDQVDEVSEQARRAANERWRRQREEDA
jgi:hypothetical protein